MAREPLPAGWAPRLAPKMPPAPGESTTSAPYTDGKRGECRHIRCLAMPLGKWVFQVSSRSRESEGNSVSNDDVRQPTQPMPGQTDGQPAAAEIAGFFDRVAALGVQPRLRAVSGTCVFNITGAGNWRATITNGLPTITHDAPEDGPADCTVECSAQDFLRIVHREGGLNVLAAFLQGLVTVTGNIGFATSLLGSVTFDPVGMPGAQPRSLR
jgi:hypothetical protein